MTHTRTWLRALRGVVAALVLALVPMPAAGACSTTLDGVVLVASEVASGIARPRVARSERTEAAVPRLVAAPSRAQTDSTARFPSPVSPAPPRARREHLYLLDCAFLC